jgi:two-component system NtrC family sensor kinase
MRQTLSTRIAIPAGFFALVSVGLLSFILIRAQREQVLAEVVHGSENIAEAILLSLDRDMRTNSRAGVNELIEALGQHADIDRIRIFNKDGEIAYSSAPNEIGRTVDTDAEACVQCHAGDNRPSASQLNSTNRSRIYRDASGKRLFATIHVIQNRAGCDAAGCHVAPTEQSVLGVLDVATSLEPAQARLAAATRNAVFISLAAVALITGILFLMISYSIRKPINRLVAVTRKIAAGGTAMALPDGGAREIGLLSAAFNEMIESLATSKQRLEEWAGTLEAKVAAEAHDLREAQFQVVQAEKLSSVGLVAAGIAHELNSPLMAIITFSHLVRSAVPADSQAQEDLRMIEREANRCAVIIRQLLDFSRKQAQEPELHACALNDVVDGALELLKIELQNAGVDVDVAVADDLPEVEANDVQLMQVFINLLVNALQAMPDGGQLKITGDVVERRLYARFDLPPHPSATLVRITIRDTGTGIARQDLARVFDPFFTTKPVGKGSGLGLSVSLGLVRGYRGTIMVDSDGASWTEFTVLLPVAKQPALVATV